jgi:hypothetical protein
MLLTFISDKIDPSQKGLGAIGRIPFTRTDPPRWFEIQLEKPVRQIGYSKNSHSVQLTN